MKILEFFSSLQEIYLSDDLVEVRFLEEGESGSGSAGLGGAVTNELTVRLVNRGGRFDVTNPDSPLRELLRPNRRVRAWLGVEGAKHLWGEGWYAPFDRDLTLSRQDGTVIEPLPDHVVTHRPGEGRVGGAVAVEEGTENLLASKELRGVGNTVTLGEDEIGKYFIKADGSIGWAGLGFPSTSVQAGEYYTFSVEIMCDIPFELSIDSNVGADNYAGNDATRESLTYYPTSYSTPGKWQKVVVTVKVKADAQNPRAYDTLLPNDPAVYGRKIYYRNWQLEQKPFATSFVDGTRVTGKLEYLQSIWNHATGTFAAWVKTPTDVTTDRVLTLQWARDEVGPDTRFGIRMNTSGRFVVSYGSADTLITADSYNDGEWHHVVLTWVDGTADIHFYVDGERVASASEPISVSNPGGRYRGVIPIGHRGYTYNDQWWNSLIDELLILPYAASEEHIARLYAQTRPLYDEWVPLGVFWSTDWDSEELEAMVRARDRMELLRRTTYE
ncbi:MAG: LamG domain-containing protein, partial [Clostridiaceae bacterium]|nr:LamG domain-containing protein [Clostridiaceae bacterium]